MPLPKERAYHNWNRRRNYEQAEPMNTQFPGMRKLASQVIILAMHDFYTAKKKLRNSYQDVQWLNLVKQEQYKEYWRLEKRYAYNFLTHDSLWHEILGFKPEYIKRKLDDPNFKFDLILNYNRDKGVNKR